MSVDQLPPGNARPAKRDAQFVRYDEYIDKQIQATRRTVKTVDIMTALLVMVTGTLGFLLTAAIVEHWLVPDGFNLAERMLLFLVLFGSLAFFTTRRLWPLIAGSINPAYAAQAIEHENPSLKNSLLNLLLFREHRDDITDAVYETLEEQAAKRLNRVPIESAVDRTPLLRLGYVLIGILAAVALYKILSPKDPFVSAERVLMPWARIARASRVSIENVEPGVVTLARGEVLTVSADVRGITDDDPVVVRYTTADGQAVDRPAPMTPSSAGLRFTGQIPPTSDGAKAGVAQNLRYRIEAGDARSIEYAVTVVSAPTITIERIDYDYPDYTQFADRSVERLGDIRAIEGTRVTIHARANEPIEDAAIDFEADGRRDVRLTPSGSDAKATFSLELRDDRQTPKFTSYVLRFTGASGRPNRDPVKFPIDVMPDRGPEVSILAPAEKMRDVRVDETVAIEVDAIDPDFALAEVRLQGEAAGNRVLDEKLLSQEHTGRYTGRHLFTPQEHDLKPGDIVRYWVTARDNRAPKPNEVTSDSQTLRIVGPNPQQPGKRPQDPNPQRDKREPQQDGASKDGQQQDGQGGDSSQSGGQSSASSQRDQQGDSQGESASADGQKGQSGEQNSSNQSGEDDSNSAQQSGEQSNDQSNQSQSGESESGESQSGNNSGSKGKSSADDKSSAGEKGNESGEAQQQPGSGSSLGQNGKPSDAKQDPSQQPGANESGSEQNGEPASAGGKQPKSGNNGDPKSGGEPSPVSSEGDNDGEAFERIQDFLKQQGKLPKEGESKDPGESASDSGDQGESKGEPASAGGKKGNASDNAKPNTDANNPDSKPNESGEKPSDKQPSNEQPSGEKPSDSKNQPASSPGSNSQQPDAKSPTGESPEKSSDPSDKNSSDSSEKKDPDSKSPDGQHTSSEGESGAGNQQPEQSTGSPESQPQPKPGDKWQQKPSGDQQGEKKGDGQDPPSGGQGKKKNDSQGDQGGDRSGGGEEGAGQKSEREGTGSAGQNQSADEGAGESSEQGTGHNSPDAGQDAKSNDPTGQSGNQEKGNGTSQREGAGDQPGGAQKQTPQGEPASAGGNQPQSKNGEPNSPNSKNPNSENQIAENKNTAQQNPAESQSNQSQPNQPNPNSSDSNSQQPGSKQPNAKQPSPNSQDSNSSSSTADGAGRVPNGTMQPSASTGEAPEADAANLEYARKQTDLVLETLAEQMKRKQVDKKLLDKLGWTEADLKRFLDRWQQLKAAADDNSPVADEAQRELDDALRSLGLRRGQLQQSKATDDTNRNLRQGYRGAIPLEYQERLRAYNQGVSRPPIRGIESDELNKGR